MRKVTTLVHPFYMWKSTKNKGNEHRHVMFIWQLNWAIQASPLRFTYLLYVDPICIQNSVIFPLMRKCLKTVATWRGSVFKGVASCLVTGRMFVLATINIGKFGQVFRLAITNQRNQAKRGITGYKCRDLGCSPRTWPSRLRALDHWGFTQRSKGTH